MEDENDENNDQLEAARKLLAELECGYSALSIQHRRAVRDRLLQSNNLAQPSMARAGWMLVRRPSDSARTPKLSS